MISDLHIRKFHIRLSNLPKIAQSVSDRAGFKLLPESILLKWYYYSHVFPCLFNLNQFLEDGDHVFIT